MENLPSKRIRILLAQLLEEDDTQLGQQAVLAALLDDQSQLAGQIRRLLPDLGALVVEPPKDGRHDLGQIRLDTSACRQT
jgi:hypothetical protein